jgi:AraC-like DNA-binding protein
MRQTIRLPAGCDGAMFAYGASPAIGYHSHDEVEFNLVVRGSLRYLVAERCYDLRRHHLIWFFPDQEHVLIDPSPDCRLWIGVVRREALLRAKADPRLAERNPAWLVAKPIPPADSNRLDDLCARLAQIHDPARFNPGLLFATLEAWAAFTAADGASAATVVDPAVDLAARLLQGEAAEASLPELAHRVGLSPGRLSRRFQAQLGVGIAEYRNRNRLERFLARYIPGGRETVLEAALAAGFGSYPQFHRVFVATLGRPPRAYFA